MPSMPQIMPPVGKSGPLTNFIRSGTVMAGLSIWAQTPSMISPRLCGGMFVAMPTAMPVPPLTRRFGKAEGKTVGSVRVWQRPRDNDGHRVVEERVLDLVGDVDLGDFLVGGVKRRTAGRQLVRFFWFRHKAYSVGKCKHIPATSLPR